MLKVNCLAFATEPSVDDASNFEKIEKGDTVRAMQFNRLKDQLRSAENDLYSTYNFVTANSNESHEFQEQLSPLWQPTHPHTFHVTARAGNIDYRVEAQGRELWTNQQAFPTHHRRPLPVLGSTQETFHVSSSTADDLATISRKSRTSAPTSYIEELQPSLWGDEKRWRNRAQVMLEEFLEMIRPRYGSAIPAFSQSQSDPSQEALIGPADREVTNCLVM